MNFSFQKAILISHKGKKEMYEKHIYKKKKKKVGHTKSKFLQGTCISYSRWGIVDNESAKLP